MQREYFTFYKSYYETISMLPKSKRLAIYEEIMRLSFENFSNNEPDFTKTFPKCVKSRMVLTALWPNIRSNMKQFLNGIKGGTPVNATNSQNPLGTQPEPTRNPLGTHSEPNNKVLNNNKEIKKIENPVGLHFATMIINNMIFAKPNVFKNNHTTVSVLRSQIAKADYNTAKDIVKNHGFIMNDDYSMEVIQKKRDYGLIDELCKGARK